MIVTWHSFGRTNEVIKEKRGIFVFILGDKWSISKGRQQRIEVPPNIDQKVLKSGSEGD